MKRRAAAALLTAFVALAAPAGAAAPLDLGGVPGYVVPDPGAALGSIQLIVRAGLDRQANAESGLASLAAQTILHAPSGGATLADALAARGVSLNAVVGGQYVRFVLDGQPEALAAAAPLVAEVLAKPPADAATVGAARAALLERAADAETDPRAVGLQMLRNAYYRGGPAMPLFGTSETLALLTPDDVGGFFTRWYVRGGALVTVAGPPGAALESAARALAAALPAGGAPQAATQTRPFGNEPRRIVTHRDVGGSYVLLGFAAPSPGNADFPGFLVLRALLGEIFESSEVTARPSFFRPSATILIDEVTPAQFAFVINGRIVDPGVGLAAVDAVLKAAAAKPLANAVLQRYRDAAHGAWAIDNITLDERASSVANVAAHGVDPAAIDAVGPAIAKVTAADVQRVAKKYLQKFDVALILPRQGSGS
ncbi:MAG TPA: hypothetical protein VGN14_06755 [Candidatus Elarobacter sp.]